VLISRIGNVGLYNWLFYFLILLTVLFHVHMCLYSRYTFPAYMCLICMPLGLISYTRWAASDNLGPVCSDFRAWSIADPSVPIRVAQQKCGLAVIRLKPLFFQPPLIGSRDSHFTTREYFPVLLYSVSCFYASW